MNQILENIKNKNILILGFGREGKSTYKFIRKEFPDIKLAIADINVNIKEDELVKNDSNITYHLGESYIESIEEYEMVIKAPGVSLKNYNIKGSKEKITSQTDLMLKYYSGNIVGVTGTKGKTTTVTLLAYTLKNADKKVVLVGNVGLPVFDEIENIENDTVIVYELSSHQLEYVHNSPHISIITNIHEEHLDHYKSYEAYKQAKLNIARFQSSKDIIIYNCDNEELAKLIKSENISSEKLCFAQEKIDNAYTYVNADSIYCNGEKVYDLNQKRNLIGSFNYYNMMAIITVCKKFGLDNRVITESINTYITQPHRLEYVGCYGGVHYYDNSIATVPIATTGAIEGLKNVDTIIIGGFDRNIDYTEFAEYLVNSEIRNILCIYDTGKKIYEMIMNMNQEKKLILCENLQEAVSIAKKVTTIGMSCLLSPTAASYGVFKNFEERGDLFKRLVRE